MEYYCRDKQADEGIRDAEAEADEYGTSDNREADESVGSGVMPVRDERRTVQVLASSKAYDRRNFVARKSDESRQNEN